MTRLIEIEEIKEALCKVNLSDSIEAGFVAYSHNMVVVPPIGELTFDNPPGDMHIKYGYIKNDDVFVIKIAAGFYNNPKLGLSSSQGLMLLFCQKTGVLKAILLDNGYLTDIRTAVAGAVVAKYFAPQSIKCIGILGAGIQGRLQLSYLGSILPCTDVMVWTPDEKEMNDYQAFFNNKGLNITYAENCSDIAKKCNFMVTTTPSKKPLLHLDEIRPGTHITAVGSDTPDKIELDPKILKHADMVVVDSLSQSRTRGEVFRAVQANMLQREDVLELGAVLSSRVRARTSEDQITIVDLTGVAVQDIQIAKAIYSNLKNAL